MTLTYDLVSRKMTSGAAYILYYLREESQIWCVDSSWDARVMHTIMGILTVTLILSPFLGFSYLEHIPFITNNLHQMCLMLDQFL